MIKRLTIGVLAALMVVSAVLTGCGRQQNAGPASTTNAGLVAAAPSTSTDSLNNGATTDGIKVHGSWTIEVTNPDGTVAERREFENALTANGASLLAMLLGRSSLTYDAGGEWAVSVEAVAAADNAFLNSSLPPGTFSPGYAVETVAMANLAPGGVSFFGGSAFPSLTVAVPGTTTWAIGSPALTIELNGFATAQRNGNVQVVKTFLNFIPGSSNPGGVSTFIFLNLNFTGTTLATPIPLVTGQTITVKVIISFS